MISTQYISLDMTPSGVMPVLYCSQYDIGRPLGMVVYNGSEAVDLSTYTVTVEATRTDGTAITTAVVTDGNIGVFLTTATMTNQADKYPAKMVIVDSNSRRVASLAFILCVTPKTMDENAESIEEDETLYQQFTEAVRTLIAEIRADLSSEITARSAADTSLQNSISAETAERRSADATLTQDIAAESVTRQTTDETLQSNIDREAAARASGDATLQNQINQLIVQPGDAPSAEEILNARIGADGVTYTTLGDAIRGQVTDCTDSLGTIQNLRRISPTWEQGNISSSTGGPITSSLRLRTSYMPYPGYGGLLLTVPTGYKVNVYIYNSQSIAGYDRAYLDGLWITANKVIFASVGQYYRLVCAKTDDGAITPETAPAIGVFAVTYTDPNLSLANMPADAKTTGDEVSWIHDELGGAVYSRLQRNPYIGGSWTNYRIDETTGGTFADTTHISTNYYSAYSDIPLEVESLSGIECCIFDYTSQEVSGYVGVPTGYKSGVQRVYIPKGHFFRVCARKSDGSDISDGTGIGIYSYADTIGEITQTNENDLSGIMSSTFVTPTWASGTINTNNGGEYASTFSIRTSYLRSNSEYSFEITAPDTMQIAVYGYTAQTVTAYTGVITNGFVASPVKVLIPKGTYYRVVARTLDQSAISTDAGDDVAISFRRTMNELNILVLGNSFSMDSFAYLPPVLDELLPNYAINYGVAYISSGSLANQVSYYNNNQKYTLYYEWNRTKGKWEGYTSTGTTDRGKTLTDIMALRGWDIIYAQPASNVTSQQYIIDNVITPGRQLLRIIQGLAQKPFTFLMGEWLGTAQDGDHGEAVFALIAAALEQTSRALGLNGYIPIGAAIQNARTIPAFQALGEGGNMLYSDGVHMQSGIAPLIASYTIALYILRLVGTSNVGVFSSTFVPTTENAIAINAYHDGHPTPMTHGGSVGVSTAYIQAAQEIAAFAIRYPTEIIDCSALIGS